jgi:hypothetical protein
MFINGRLGLWLPKAITHALLCLIGLWAEKSSKIPAQPQPKPKTGKDWAGVFARPDAGRVGRDWAMGGMIRAVLYTWPKMVRENHFFLTHDTQSTD